MKIINLKTIIFSMLINAMNVCGQTDWTKYSGNPVLIKGPDNFDIIAVGQPTALFENDTLKMWYVGVGNDMKGRICYAYSTDGINWTKHANPVIDVGAEGEWDSGWLDTPEIVKDNTGYKMYYYGDTVQQFAAISSAIGVASSGDGITWVKHIDNPVFIKGNIGEWDGSWVESPAVVYDTNTDEYKMWYNGVDTATWKVQIGLATSPDGVNWTKYSSNPVVATSNWGGYDDMWAGTPTVIKSGNLFEMWYSGTSTGSYNILTGSFDTISICYATSINGIDWTKHPNNPLFNTFATPYDSLVDKGGPWAPCVIFNPVTNNYMMWYEAQNFSLATAPKTTTHITENYYLDSDLIVYPNPFHTSAILKTNKEIENATLILFNSCGQIVLKQSNIYSDEIKIYKGSLPNGIYTFQLSTMKRIKTGKFIIN